jgi:hypothetical protein
MADRVCIALPDGRWLALDKETFDTALAAGLEFGPSLTTCAASTPLEELLTAEQLAGRLKLPQSCIEQSTREGRLPCHQFGRYRRYSIAVVIEAAAKRRRVIRE